MEKKQTKTQMIAQIHELAYEYLGWRNFDIAGLKSKSASYLADLLVQYERMVNLSRQEKELRSHFSRNQQDYYYIFCREEDRPAELRQADKLSREANEIWLGR